MMEIRLPNAGGAIVAYRQTGTPIAFEKRKARDFSRVAFAAAHVVVNPLADNEPWLDVAVDWQATLDYRRYVWDPGFGVTEAMDTAQRGGGLDWTGAPALIRHALAGARDHDDALIACGVGIDQLPPGPSVTIDDVIAAYETQLGFVEGLGGRVILMASRALAAAARGPDDDARVDDRILRQAKTR